MKNNKPLSEMTLEELWELFPIELSEHNPKWKKWFREEEELLLRVFGSNHERIQHIGSTAVEGLLAKPTIDILLEMPENVPPESIRKMALACGYTVMKEMLEPEYRLDLCKGYTPQGFAERVFHLHIRRIGDWDEPIFCEYLRRNPDKSTRIRRFESQTAEKVSSQSRCIHECQGGFYSSVREIRQGTEVLQQNNMIIRMIEINPPLRCRPHSPPPKKRGEEFARENNSRPLPIVDFLLKIGSWRFSTMSCHPLKTV